MLMSLPEEMRLRVLGCCSPRALFRLEGSCVALRELLRSAQGERLWQQLLHEVWLRNPRCSHYGAQRWWLCQTPELQLALPWRVCGDTDQCSLLRQLSYRESYIACLLDRERSRITDEELVTLRWSVNFCGMAAYLPLANNLRPASPIALRGGDTGESEDGGAPAVFHRDGCFEDGVLFTRGSRLCRWVRSQPVPCAQPGQVTDRVDTLALLSAEGREGSRHLKVRFCTQHLRC